ncbi:unnamed protein product [Vitrella brassicaformis CCMP3155]|uniref:Exonuclease domain-containing protein n=1 Tax=Vitrella brassicaformis (strain CCMP3155) TaxID=1169540 RepID=A0A0G4ENN7_VITBC|nr:unnamed protein product [Vitrella brassicaformis CCMP3155]|eukprot:CEL98567.1 unnamed protein product [Vitrella brassicaformis CCMP3155]
MGKKSKKKRRHDATDKQDRDRPHRDPASVVKKDDVISKLKAAMQSLKRKDAAKHSHDGARPKHQHQQRASSSGARRPDKKGKMGGKSVLGLDCEMVGVGPNGATSELARISICDDAGRIVMDEVVRPRSYVSDLRSSITGLTLGRLKQGISFDEARTRALLAMKGALVVGHAIHHDFQALEIDADDEGIQWADTQRLYPHSRKQLPSLQSLAKKELGITLRRNGVHDSIEDAHAAVKLYQHHLRETKKARKGPAAGVKSKGEGQHGKDATDVEIVGWAM